MIEGGCGFARQPRMPVERARKDKRYAHSPIRSTLAEVGYSPDDRKTNRSSVIIPFGDSSHTANASRHIRERSSIGATDTPADAVLRNARKVAGASGEVVRRSTRLCLEAADRTDQGRHALGGPLESLTTDIAGGPGRENEHGGGNEGEAEETTRRSPGGDRPVSEVAPSTPEAAPSRRAEAGKREERGNVALHTQRSRGFGSRDG